MSLPRRDIVTYEAAQNAFAALEQLISEESDPANLLDLMVHINTLLDLVDERIEKMQMRLSQ